MTVIRSRKIVVATAATAAHVFLLFCTLLILTLFSAVSARALTALVLGLALAKCLAYGAYLRVIVLQMTRRPARFHDFLVTLCGLMFVIIASFACDFYCLYCVDGQSLAALSAEAPALETLFNCWYFSVLNFSFFGVSDILPTMLPTRLLLAMETLTSFLTVVFVLSDFVALRESIRRAAYAP